MQSLIEKDPHNAERIMPYMGGEEINTSPTACDTHRYVIDFEDFPYAVTSTCLLGARPQNVDRDELFRKGRCAQ